MNAWFAEIAIGIGASFAATLLVKATLTLAVALAVTGLARRSRAAARHVLLVAAFAVLLALPAASFVMPLSGRNAARPARRIVCAGDGRRPGNDESVSDTSRRTGIRRYVSD